MDLTLHGSSLELEVSSQLAPRHYAHPGNLKWQEFAANSGDSLTFISQMPKLRIIYPLQIPYDSKEKSGFTPKQQNRNGAK